MYPRGCAMPDGWMDSFDDPSPYAFEAHRWQRYEHEAPLLRGKAVLLGVAVVVLLGFVATDVAYYENVTAPVDVSVVNWYTAGQLVGTSHGFVLHTSEAFNLTFACVGLCYRYLGAVIGSPFRLVSTQIFYYPTEYLNLTIQAPSTGYTGPLTVSLMIV